MALTTYAELQASIGDWLARSDLTSAIPDFITLFEAMANRDIRHRSMLTTATVSFTANDATEALPTDFLEARSFSLSTSPRTVLEYVTPQAFDAADTGAIGLPARFAIVGSNVKVAPTPDGAYTGALLYYQKIPALTGSNASNWLLQAAPDMYLYGSLLQAAPYLKDDGRVTMWGSMYDRARQGLAAADERAQWNGGPLVQRVDVRVS